MSEPVSALGGAVFDGAVKVTELPPRAMFSLKGDLASKKIVKAATGLTGVDLPGPNSANGAGENGILWMAPDEILLMGPRTDQATAAARLEKALAGTHHLLADVSDARSVFLVEGEGSALREALARLTPADLHPEAFPVGAFRRTRLAQVPAALWMRDGSAVEVLVFRSVAAYVFGLLGHAAAGGSLSHF
ncbi:MAG: sarcosine oxidase subunit gamma family protein [Paracoccaceae bacterium]|nr:sarcosine oxidase subunit gamma family protein [Paracoccaceae bacterium]